MEADICLGMCWRQWGVVSTVHVRVSVAKPCPLDEGERPYWHVRFIWGALHIRVLVLLVRRAYLFSAYRGRSSCFIPQSVLEFVGTE